MAEVDELDRSARACERLVFALRRLAGVRRDWFESVTGYAIDDLAGATIGRYVDVGLLEDDGQTIRLTRNGLLVSDALWPEFLMG